MSAPRLPIVSFMLLCLALLLPHTAAAQSAGSACATLNWTIYPSYTTGGSHAYICDGAHLVTLETMTASPLQKGIGTTSPQATLDVAGEVRIGNTSLACSSTTKGAIRYNTTSNAIEMCNSSSWIALSTGAATAASPTSSIQFNSGGTFGGSANLTWDNTNGRLGIGTATPSGRLDVETNSSSKNLLTLVNSSATYGVSTLMGQDTSSKFAFFGYYGSGESTANSLVGNTAYVGAGSGAAQLMVNTNGAIPIIFATDNWVERMRIQPTTGNVGIGTTTPSTLLHVSRATGTGDIVTFAGSDGSTVIDQYGNFITKGLNPTVGMDGSGIASMKIKTVGGKDWRIEQTRNSAAGTLEFTNLTDASSSPRMVILAGGNVGIGTTSPNAKLTVSGGGVSTGTASNTDFAGQLTLVSGTESYTFTGTYTGTPVCVASDTAATPVAAEVTTTASTLTLTVPGGANTDTFNYICIARN